MKRSRARDLLPACLFLGPNFAGFCVFVAFPVVFSVVMAFTNWDLALHNPYRDEAIRWIWLDNFIEMFTTPDFWKFLGNTLFLMMGIPIGIAGSLLLAVMLTRRLRSRDARTRAALAAGSLLAFGLAGLVFAFSGGGVVGLVMFVLAGGVLAVGFAGGPVVYRTLCYLPHFTAGVAVYLLWKQMFNPIRGPINASVQPVLDRVARVCTTTGSGLWDWASAWLWLPAVFGLAYIIYLRVKGSSELRTGLASRLVSILALAAGALVVVSTIGGSVWLARTSVAGAIWFVAVFGAAYLGYLFIRECAASRLSLNACLAALAGLVITLVIAISTLPAGPWFWRMAGGLLWVVAIGGTERLVSQIDHNYKEGDIGAGSGLLGFATVGVGALVLLAIGYVLIRLPGWSADGLEAPRWLNDVDWAKPGIMIMGLWAAVGSNNMLLYIAGISNIPPELYEAAEVDGAGGWARFWNVTWPQLAPTTFFIVIMSFIGGLQGGFEVARTMTGGGPFGSTTTLAYYVYNQGFEAGRLGYASAIAWVMFAMIFVLTVLNYRFGSRYINE